MKKTFDIMRKQSKNNWDSRSRNGKSNVRHHDNVANNEVWDMLSDNELFETTEFEDFCKEFAEVLFKSIRQAKDKGGSGVELSMNNPETGNTFFSATLEGDFFNELFDKEFAVPAAIMLSKCAYLGMLGEKESTKNI